MNTHTRKTSGLDLAAVRAQVDGQSGPRYWRSLEELAETAEFTAYVHREFPEQASEWSDPTGRRNFLRLMGASLALAGVGSAGCDPASVPPEKILPYVRQPENLVQGVPLHYATAVSLGGVGTGVVAETHMGRPTMVEGNPGHPDSAGAIDCFTQASVLGLYDPDRAQTVKRGREIGTFDGFLLAAVSALDAQRPRKGAGLRVLTGTVTSPTLARQIRALLKEFPEARWHQYEPSAPHARRAGLKAYFGRDLAPRHHVERADVILSIDADFLANGVGRLPEALGYGRRRTPHAGEPGMNRLYTVEPSMTVTGSSSDHRLPLRARDLAGFAAALARAVKVPNVPDVAEPEAVKARRSWVAALARDLEKSRGKSLVLAGASQPAFVHALVAAINHALGNDADGGPVEYAAPADAEPVDHMASLADLCGAMNAGSVDVLIVLGGNPAYTAPADSGFAAGLKRVKFSARLGLHEDETSALCGWHVPEAHELETWGDVLASDGTATIQQPMIAPLYGGLSAIELVAALLRHPNQGGHEIVRDTWRARAKERKTDFETFWRTSVHAGVVEGTKLPAVSVEPKGTPSAAPSASSSKGEGIEIVFRPDPTIWDGQFSNNGWLQELPKPITKLTWENVAHLSLATAERLGVTTGDVVELSHGGRKVEAPVWVAPGQTNDSVTIHFGYGRTRVGRIGKGMGFNAFALWTSEVAGSGFASGAVVRALGRTHKLASTQMHRNVDWELQGKEQKERGIAQATTLAAFRAPGYSASEGEHTRTPPKDLTLYHDDVTPTNPVDADYQWGMVVDLNSCTGCGACVLACQAENNIPVVGKDQVLASREMHWIEVDRYYEGAPDNPEVVHQPRLCMHCEKAPCELVCPVAATVHDHEGLNVMIYNRCVGTRYCSNNCPYKVRHFNFLQYSDLRTPSLALLSNPDVTVRARGVMEKCSYCVQRISQARYTSEIEGRRIKDGEVTTACQSACPTRAITFGDISDPTSAVAQLKTDARNYGMLAELNTQPRTSYLAKLRNPNPEIETETRHGV